MPMQATTTTPLFSAALKPDRSARIMGGWVAYAIAVVAATPLAVLAPEVLIPALSAFGIGGAAMTAISVHQSRQRRMAQQVTLWADQLEIATTSAGGVRTLRRLDPKTVRLVLSRDDNEKTVAMRLRSGQDEVELGAFLKPEDRASFARAFGTALRQARQAA